VVLEKFKMTWKPGERETWLTGDMVKRGLGELNKYRYWKKYVLIRIYGFTRLLLRRGWKFLGFREHFHGKKYIP